jgi:hypothetical protein
LFGPEVEVNIGELTLVVNGALWEVGDAISIPVYKASGVEDVYTTKFTTSKYDIITPRSKKIEFISDVLDPIRVVKTIPGDGTFGNRSINPIVIKFNKEIKPEQTLTDKIQIKRLGLDTGITKNITQYYKIAGDTVKVYMISTSRRV